MNYEYCRKRQLMENTIYCLETFIESVCVINSIDFNRDVLLTYFEEKLQILKIELQKFKDISE